MKDLPEYELLSAYLDGELTAEERAQVEQLLAGNPAARQLLDEMRTLSSSLKSLPSHRLEENLSQRVLRVAERRMLSESNASEPPPAASPAEHAEGPSIGQQLLRPRTWLWPAVAVAAALLMWFRAPEVAEPVAERKLAMAPKAEAPAEPPSMQAPRGLAYDAATPAREAAEAESISPAMPDAAAGRPSSNAIAAGAPAEEPALREVPKEALKTAEKKEGVGSRVLTLKSAPAAAQPMPSAAPQPASEPMPNDLATEAHAPARHAGKGAPLALEAKAPEAAKANDAPLLIVRCEITREAARRQVFQEILAAEQLDRSNGVPMRQGITPKKNASQGQAGASGEMMRAPDDSAIEFSATRDEVLTLLAKLKARPDLFVSVPEPSQLGLLAIDAKTAPQTQSLTGGEEGAAPHKQQRSVESLQPAYSPKGQQGGQQSAAADSGVSHPMSQPQALAQDRMEVFRDKSAMQDRDKSDEPTYRVRVELRVVSNPATPGQPAQPAKPAASTPEP